MLWEILVPATNVAFEPFPMEHHRAWDAKIKDLAGGLTIHRSVKGEWVAPDGTTFNEPMIPVRVMCDHPTIMKIADITAEHYSQKAVMYYRISDYVVVKHYGEAAEKGGTAS